jgi:predicted ribosome quality control (RQC) complex YloA/Tae2 family protein
VSAPRASGLSAFEVGELVAELAPLVTGAHLAEVVALPPRDLVLYFKFDAGSDGRTLVRKLRLSADGDRPRLYLQTARQERPDGPVGPFFRRCAEELAGARLRRISQSGRDRIVVLEFEDAIRGERRGLVAELVGRHSNLVLLGPSEKVLDVLVPPPGSAKSAPRLQLGAPWTPPPGTPREIAGESGLWARLSPAPVDTDSRAEPLAPLSFLVQEVLGREVSELASARARRDLQERLERKLERARSLEHGLVQRLAASQNAEEVRLDGEALKAHMHLVSRGMSEVAIPDPYSEDPRERRIELDPRRSPRENVELVFERYKKLLRARESVERELELARERLGHLSELCVRCADPASDARALEARALSLGVLEPQQATSEERERKAPEPRKPYKLFRGRNGAEIRVGRNAADNDDLTFHHSKGGDLWLHTADCPGSHVILCLDKGAEPDPEDLLDAAHLAAHFSPMREATKVNVHVARRKEVHKPKGAKPGLVTLSGGKVVALRMQPERLRRLLDPTRA